MEDIKKLVEKIDFDPDREIVVTEGGLMLILEGIAQINVDVNDAKDRLSDEDYRGLMIDNMVMFASIVRLFRRDIRDGLFEVTKKVTGMDFKEIL